MRDYRQAAVELEEAAVVDGASAFRVFRSVTLPLSVPGLVATFLIVLVFAWNEYLLALFLSSATPRRCPLPWPPRTPPGARGGVCRCSSRS